MSDINFDDLIDEEPADDDEDGGGAEGDDPAHGFEEGDHELGLHDGHGDTEYGWHTGDDDALEASLGGKCADTALDAHAFADGDADFIEDLGQVSTSAAGDVDGGYDESEVIAADTFVQALEGVVEVHANAHLLQHDAELL